jgi:YVTN family beta-propeller protein
MQFALKVVGFALLIISAGTGASDLRGYVYTANEKDASISEIVLTTGQVRTFKAPVVPHNVQITPDGAYLLAVGMPVEQHRMKGAMQQTESKHDGDDAGQLLIFDVRNLEAPIAALPAGKHPAHVVADTSGKRAFVTSSEDNAVTVVDLTRRAVIGTVATGGAPHGLRPSPDGRELYVANVADNSVSVVDTATLKEVARIPVGKAPVQVAFTRDGRQVYVSLRDENRVAVIDSAALRVIGKIDVARNPIQLYAAADGKGMYVANQGSAKAPDNRVSVIDIATGKVIGTVTTGAGAHGVVADNDRTAFVTNIEAGTVSAIDTSSRQVTATYKVGAGPNGITYRPEAAAVAADPAPSGAAPRREPRADPHFHPRDGK